MISVKKLRSVFLFILFFIISPQVFGNSLQENKNSDFFSFALYSGIRNGKIENLLLLEENKNKVQNTVSCLDWIFYTPSIGFSADFFLLKSRKIKISTNADFSVPSSFGFMEDFDWMNFYSTGDDFLTHYSWNKNRTESFINSNVQAGYCWKITDFFSITTSAEISYEHFSFTAFDGFRQYGEVVDSDGLINEYAPWNEQIQKVLINGDAVKIVGNFVFAGGGIKLNFIFPSRIEFGIGESVFVSVFGKEIDYHLRKKKSDFQVFGYDLLGVMKYHTVFDFTYRIGSNQKIGIYSFVNFIPQKANSIYQRKITETDNDWQRIKDKESTNYGSMSKFEYSINLCYNLKI